MSRISIDKPLTPGQTATFIVDMSFFGYSRQESFKIKVPNAVPLMNKVNNILVTSKRGVDKEKTKGDFAFNRYVKKGNSGDFYTLAVRLVNPKQANELKPGDEINFKSTDPKLINLNTKNYNVIANNNKNKSYVYLKVSKLDQPNPTSASAANVSGSSLQEITGTVKTRKYTVTLPNKVFNGLIAETIPNEPVTKGMVEDIPIYAYKKFQGKDSASVKRKLLNNNDDINEKEPPNRVDVISFRNKRSYSNEFVVDEEDKFIFYVSIARYIYDGDGWKKQWLQKNASRETIWGKAVEKK